jgi:hypothetical protein
MDPLQHRSSRQFYERQLAYLQAHDVEGLIADHYHDDALLVTFGGTARGSEALDEQFRRYLDQIGHLEVISTDRFTATGDSIFLEATMTTDLGTTRVYDAFVLREGKIAYHFAGEIGAR